MSGPRDGRWTNAWQRLAPRERSLIAVGGTVVLLVVVWVALWEPAEVGIRRLRADLPQLRVQDASMRAMADDVATLRRAGAVSVAPPVDDRVASVRRTLDRAGLARGGAAPAATGPVTTLSTQGAVVSVAAAASGPAEPPEVAAEQGGRVRVRFSNIDYGVWIAWLATTEGELSARASKVAVASIAGGPPGRVRAETVLDWPAPGASASRASAPSSSAP